MTTHVEGSLSFSVPSSESTCLCTLSPSNGRFVTLWPSFDFLNHQKQIFSFYVTVFSNLRARLR